MITEDRLSKALRYLAESDIEAAQLKTDVKRAEYKLKKIEATLFIHYDGAVRERESMARTSDGYQKAVDEYLKAYQASEEIQNKRITESLIVDVWRTEQANRRQGNV